MEYFPEEYFALTQEKPVQANAVTRHFNQILSERKIILIGGQLQQTIISNREALPVSLPSISHLSNLITNDCYKKTRNGDVSETFTQLKRKNLILRARKRIMSLILKCNLCQTF